MTSVAVLARKFERNVNDYGWRMAIRKSVAYLLSPLCQSTTYRIGILDFDGQPASRPADATDIDYVILKSQDTETIAQIERWAEWLQGGVRAKLAAGALCLAALRNDTLAGFYLVVFGEANITPIALRRTFRPGTAWSEHIAVGKELRNRGVGVELCRRAFSELRSRGIRKLYAGMLPSNVRSLGLAAKIGFRPLADVTYTCVLGWKAWKYRRCERRSPQDRINASRKSAAIQNR